MRILRTNERRLYDSKHERADFQLLFSRAKRPQESATGATGGKIKGYYWVVLNGERGESDFSQKKRSTYIEKSFLCEICRHRVIERPWEIKNFQWPVEERWEIVFLLLMLDDDVFFFIHY